MASFAVKLLKEGITSLCTGMRATTRPLPLRGAVIWLKEVKMTGKFEFLESFLDPFFNRLAEVGFKNLNEVEKTFIGICSLEGEVNNGGFDQWFFNSSGDWALETPQSLIRIGAEATARIVEEAISFFPGGNPSEDLEKRRKQMKEVNDVIEMKWNELDNKFYEHEDDLEKLLAHYMKENKDTI